MSGLEQQVEMPAGRADRRWVGFRTIVIREFSRIVRIWGQTLVPPAITATLYFLIFGSLIGRRIGDAEVEKDAWEPPRGALLKSDAACSALRRESSVSTNVRAAFDHALTEALNPSQ